MNGIIQKVILKGKTLFSFFRKKYLNDNDRTSNWVVQLSLKYLHTIYLFKRKQTEASEINLKYHNLAVTEEADVDEVVPIYLKNEQNTQAYKKTMKIYIEYITYLKIATNEIEVNFVQSTKL